MTIKAALKIMLSNNISLYAVLYKKTCYTLISLSIHLLKTAKLIIKFS